MWIRIISRRITWNPPDYTMHLQWSHVLNHYCTFLIIVHAIMQHIEYLVFLIIRYPDVVWLCNMKLVTCILINCWLNSDLTQAAIEPCCLHNIFDLLAYLLWSHSLWLSSLTVVNSRWTGRCTGLPGMYGVHGTSATQWFCYHNTLAHPLLHHCLLDLHPLGYHLIPSTSLPDGSLTPQCSWECRKPQQMLSIVLHGCWLCSPALYKK